MTIIPTQNVWFDDAATLANGRGFRQCLQIASKFRVCRACDYRGFDHAGAKNGERDPARLYEQAIIIFAIEDTSMPLVSVGRETPVPTYALVTRT